MKQHLRTLIATGKTKQAIQQLLNYTQTLSDQDLQQEIIMQSARFEDYQKANRLGTSTAEDNRLSQARINQALLDIIDRLPANDVKSPVPPKETASTPVNTKTDWWKYVTATAVIIGILGSLAEVFNFINFIPAKSSDTAQMTIYVHGPNGLQDYVIENEGEVLVDLDGDRRFAKIGEKGRTVFNEIPAKFQGQLLPVGIKADGYELAQPDSKHLWEGKAIYLKVQPASSLREIKGIVKNQDASELLANVQVMIENEFTTMTDSLGRFTYTVEAKRVKDKYTLSFRKEGFEPLTEYYYPQSSQEFRLKKE